jgi:hypothetical protein
MQTPMYRDIPLAAELRLPAPGWPSRPREDDACYRKPAPLGRGAVTVAAACSNTRGSELEGRSTTAARLFDIRRIIGRLFVIYGAIVTIAGIAASDAPIDKPEG